METQSPTNDQPRGDQTLLEALQKINTDPVGFEESALSQYNIDGKISEELKIILKWIRNKENDLQEATRSKRNSDGLINQLAGYVESKIHDSRSIIEAATKEIKLGKDIKKSLGEIFTKNLNDPYLDNADNCWSDDDKKRIGSIKEQLKQAIEAKATISKSLSSCLKRTDTTQLDGSILTDGHWKTSDTEVIEFHMQKWSTRDRELEDLEKYLHDEERKLDGSRLSTDAQSQSVEHKSRDAKGMIANLLHTIRTGTREITREQQALRRQQQVLHELVKLREQAAREVSERAARQLAEKVQDNDAKWQQRGLEQERDISMQHAAKLARELSGLRKCCTALLRDKQALQAQLHQQERLDGLRSVALAIAHDERAARQLAEKVQDNDAKWQQRGLEQERDISMQHAAKIARELSGLRKCCTALLRDKQALQAQLHQQERLDGLRSVALAIAHDDHRHDWRLARVRRWNHIGLLMALVSVGLYASRWLLGCRP